MKINIIKIFLTVLVIITLFTNMSFAALKDYGITNIDDYNPSASGYTEVAAKAGSILGVIQVIGSVLSVIILIVLGIKYMLGSVEEKASFKESLKPYIIGVFLLFTGTLLPSLIYNLINK